MIPLTRGAVRSFLAVARRAAPNGRRPETSPLVRLVAAADEFTLTGHFGPVVLGRRFPGEVSAGAEFVVPLEDLRALDGRGDLAIELAQTAPDVVTARWTDDAGPHESQLTLILGSTLVWPAEPKKLWPVKPDFLAALHEAGKTAARESPNRYTTDHVQVRGKAGQVIATDGRQALTLGGFAFPFPDDLIVPAVLVFGCKDLARESAISVGLAKDWLFLVIGPWRAWLRTNRAGRFPDVAGVIPRGVVAQVTFAERDAERLMVELPRLPGGEADTSPATLDVDTDRIEVRGRGEKDTEAAVISLPGSTATGPPTRLVFNRRHFGRALALGCRELTVTATGKPLVFRGPDRTYLSVPLDPAAAVPPADADRVARALARPGPEPEPDPVLAGPPRPGPDPASRAPAEPGPADGPDPLAEAEGLRAALAEAAGRAARLVIALRQARRERRVLASAWSSLRRLDLGALLGRGR